MIYKTVILYYEILLPSRQNWMFHKTGSLPTISITMTAIYMQTLFRARIYSH